MSSHFLGKIILSRKISVLDRMEEILSDMMEFFIKPSITETFVDILLCAVPIWLAVMIGLVIGWSWRPRWTGLLYLGLRSKFRFLWTAPPGFGARRLWLAFTALSAFSLCRTIWSNFKGKGKVTPPSAGDSAASGSAAAAESSTEIVGLVAKGDERVQDVVTETDLEHLVSLIGGREGEVEWQSLMERSTASMAYKAWRHDPEDWKKVEFQCFLVLGAKVLSKSQRCQIPPPPLILFLHLFLHYVLLQQLWELGLPSSSSK